MALLLWGLSEAQNPRLPAGFRLESGWGAPGDCDLQQELGHRPITMRRERQESSREGD